MLQTETDTNEQPTLIECREVYGQGTIVTMASFDTDAGAAILDQHSRNGSMIIAITTAEAAQKLSQFFAKAATVLPHTR